MDALDLYDEHARERLVPEPPKRVDAPERTPFERDRARVVHAAASRRLAAKTQVVGPQSDDFVRNRLTHSLEVAQVARDLSRALGSLPDIAETAALANRIFLVPFVRTNNISFSIKHFSNFHTSGSTFCNDICIIVIGNKTDVLRIWFVCNGQVKLFSKIANLIFLEMPNW